MPEFIPRPRESGLAALIAQMQASQSSPIAQGIMQAGQSIGNAFAASGQANRADATRRDSLVSLLAEKGLLHTGQPGQPMTGTVAPGGARVWDQGIPLEQAFPSMGFQPGSGMGLKSAQDKKGVKITSDMIDNYPKIKNMGYEIGDTIPTAVFIAQTRTERVEKEKAPPGYRFKPDGNLEAIAGGPAEAKIEKEDAKAKGSKDAAFKQAGRIIDTIDRALTKVGATSTGLGSAMSAIPGTKAKDLQADLTTIKANLGFAELQAMRQASPTGGALGAIAVQELEALQSTLASLDQKQSGEQLRDNLLKVRKHYSNWAETLNQSGNDVTAKPTTKAASEVGPIALSGDKAKRLAELRAKMANGGK